MVHSHPKLTEKVRKHVIELSNQSVKDAKIYLARTLGVKKSQKNEWFRRVMQDAGLPVPSISTQATYNADTLPPQKTAAKATYTGDFGVAESVDKGVRTLEQLIEACKIDLNVWEVEKYVVNKWEVAMREPATTVGGRGGDALISTSENGSQSTLWTRANHRPLHETMFQVKAWLRKKKEALEIRKLFEQFLSDAENHAPISFKWKPASEDRDCIYVLNLQDIHIAKLAYKRETGEADWDIRLAERAYEDAVDDLMAKAPRHRIEEVVTIVGSDMIQFDNDLSQTSKGTYVDSDSRLSKAYDITTQMLTRVIEKLATNFKVRVVSFPGNHDTVVSMHLGYYIAAWFRNHPNVIVDKEAKSRKYVPYGVNLIGFDHGDEAKLSNLPLTMMRENQCNVSQFKYLEVLTGHYHRDASEEYQGVKVRIAPALCPADRWHARKGFVRNIRTSQGLLYQRENGIEAIYYSKPLE